MARTLMAETTRTSHAPRMIRSFGQLLTSGPDLERPIVTLFSAERAPHAVACA